MSRFVAIIGLCGVCVGFGCGGGSEPSAAQASSGAEQRPSKPPPLPAPFEGTFTVQVRVPLQVIAAQIDAQLPTREAQDMAPLTREGKSPALEASYKVWRDPVMLRYAGGALHVEVPLRYAARFNARVKNPFGGWLNVAKDEPWGSHDDPQRVSLRAHTQVEVNARWELVLRSVVDRPDHGPPPDGKLCTGGSFKLCVSKASVAPEVRRRVDAEIIPRMQRALEQADQRLQAAVALRSRIERAWQALAQPRRLGDRDRGHDRWVVVEPRQAALELRADGDAIIVEPAIYARVSYHEGKPQAGAPTPLPDKSALGELPGKRMQLPAELVPAQLGQWLELFTRGRN